ncbi:MAG: MFS transporter [Enterocloster sp.]
MMANSPISGNRDFRLMVIGQIISILGSALLRFALSLYVLDITGRADIYAALYAFSNIPLLISPVGGAVADRFNRRNLMVLFDFTSGIIISLYYVSLCLGGTSIFLTGAVLILLSVISSMYGPAATASIPLLVKEEHLEGANGLVNGVQALSNVAALRLAACSTAYSGSKPCSASGTAFICSAVLSRSSIFLQTRIHHARRSHHCADLKEGFLCRPKSFILRSMILLPC